MGRVDVKDSSFSAFVDPSPNPSEVRVRLFPRNRPSLSKTSPHKKERNTKVSTVPGAKKQTNPELIDGIPDAAESLKRVFSPLRHLLLLSGSDSLCCFAVIMRHANGAATKSSESDKNKWTEIRLNEPERYCYR